MTLDTVGNRLMKAKFENLDLIDLEAAARQLVDDGKLSDAKECYLELLDRQPDWEAGLAEYELGLVHEELGEYREALRRYESAIARRPYDEMFWQVVVMLTFKMGDLEACFDAICGVIQMNPTGYGDVFYAYLGKCGERMNLTKSEVEAKVRERVAGFSYEERHIPARFLELWGL